MKRFRSEPIDEEAASEDPWLWVEDELPTAEMMRNRKREELASFFAKEMQEKPSPWKFWFPEDEVEEWKAMFEGKLGFKVVDQYNKMKGHSMGGTRCLYKVKIPKKKPKFG
mgnify:CR=1 FL=1